MIQVNRIYLIFNRLVTKKFLVDTSDIGLLVSTKKRNSFLRYLKISRLLEKIGPADLNLYLCSYNSTADVPGQIHFRPVDRFFGQESL